MFPIQIWLAYTLASVLIVLAPGPDIILSIARGLSQGRLAATLSALGAGTGILVHSVAAAYGLALIIQASTIAFLAVKLIGAAYLVWLGARALLYRNLVTFAPTARRPLHAIYLAGLMSNVLNPKIGLFVLAFIPQFVSADRGPVTMQMMTYGAWLAVIAVVGLSLIGSFASVLSGWLLRRPRMVAGINIGAGITFVATGLSAAAIKHR
ncbi:LysE family translocator [Mesorhizobium sp. M00.F.Ca.ET.216.01.1.1]|uniref:LysE family translocator n=1 Tax=Mesorhizobium sp. M00.F.Ca.ET.216.01.1.1 TaxID=2500528 RepID=UPI000FD6D569|nr:LysE family translocator [Mesorhizobium sp. M00.F.Ca.ET.216.01.1.1]TGQ30868.1 LysE family translocator [Mesorhizobium sp. M00.F.Ca.ET.216.01.1.1]